MSNHDLFAIPGMKGLILSRAVGGSAIDIHYLSLYVTTMNDYDMGLCDRLLPLLRPVRIPSGTTYESLTFRNNPDNAMNCAYRVFCVITAVCSGLRNAHPSRHLAVNFLNHNLDTFFQWIEFFISKGEHLSTSAALVMMFTSMDDDLLRRTMSSYEVIDLFLGLWIGQDDDGTYPIIFKHNLCPILDLLNGFLKHNIGRSHFHALLNRDSSRIKSVAQTVRARIQQLAEHHHLGKCTWTFTIRHFRELLQFASKLMRTHRDWAAFFGAVDLLRIIPEQLCLLSKGKTDEDCWKLVVEVLRQISAFTLNAPLGTYPALLKVKSLVAGGALPLLVDCLEHIPATSEDHLIALLMFQHIAAYSIYHEVSSILEGTIEELAQPLHRLYVPANRLAPRDKAVFAVCLAVWQTASAHSETNDTPKTFCDAVSHTGIQVSGEQRQCSSCRSVVYCSEECQSRDWREFHRNECNFQAHIWSKRRSGGWVSSKNRMYFAALLRGLAGYHVQDFEQLRVTRGLATPLDHLIRFVNCRSAPPTIDIVTIGDFRRRVAGLPEYLKKRIDAYILQASEGPDVYLAEALFPYGGASFHLLVKFVRGSDGQMIPISVISPACDSYTLPYDTFSGVATIERESENHRALPLLLNLRDRR